MNAELTASRERPDSISALIRSRASGRFDTARKWFSKLDLESAEEYVINKVADALSHNLLDGVVQLTIENVRKTQQCQNAFRSGGREIVFDVTEELPEMLPTFDAYVEFVPKIGLMEIASVRFTFSAKPEVEVKGVHVTVSEGHIDNLSVDSLKVSAELSMVKPAKVWLGTIEREIKIRDGSVAQESGDWIASPTPEMKYCVKCGARIAEDAKFCGKCGAMQH